MNGVDLPKLQYMELGYASLCGSEEDESCSLTMRSRSL